MTWRSGSFSKAADVVLTFGVHWSRPRNLSKCMLSGPVLGTQVQKVRGTGGGCVWDKLCRTAALRCQLPFRPVSFCLGRMFREDGDSFCPKARPT